MFFVLCSSVSKLRIGKSSQLDPISLFQWTWIDHTYYASGIPKKYFALMEENRPAKQEVNFCVSMVRTLQNNPYSKQKGLIAVGRNMSKPNLGSLFGKLPSSELSISEASGRLGVH